MNNATGSAPFLFINYLQINFQKGIDKSTIICYTIIKIREQPETLKGDVYYDSIKSFHSDL